jgi:hypothetical protein
MSIENNFYKFGPTRLWTERKPAPNSTYKKLAVQWLIEALCPTRAGLRNRQLLEAAKR